MPTTLQEKPEQNAHFVGLGDYVREIFGPIVTTNLVRINSALERLRKKRSQAAEDGHVSLVAMYDVLVDCHVEHGKEFETFGEQLHIAANELGKIDAKVKSTLPACAYEGLG